MSFDFFSTNNRPRTEHFRPSFTALNSEINKLNRNAIGEIVLIRSRVKNDKCYRL